MKKILCIILSLFFVLTMFGCGNKKQTAVNSKNGKEYRIAYMTDTYGEEDFRNKQVIEGVKESFANYEYDFDIVTPAEISDYENTATALLSSTQYDLVIANSSAVCSALLSVKSDYPGSDLGFIEYADETNNAMSITFKNQEAAFLAGVLAGMYTSTNTVGYIGGYEDRNTEYQYGFESGVKAVNSNIKVETAFLDSYMSTQEGAKKAMELKDKNVDIIFTVCGAGAIGVETFAQSNDIKVIDSDLYAKSDNDIKLAQITKDYKSAAISICDSVIFASYNTNQSELGVSDSVLDLLLNNNLFDESSDEYKMIEKVKRDIVTDNLIIPTDKESLEAFKYNIND